MSETRRVVSLTVAQPYGGTETIIAACDDGACFRLVRRFGEDGVQRDVWCPITPVPGTQASVPPTEEA